MPHFGEGRKERSLEEATDDVVNSKSDTAFEFLARLHCKLQSKHNTSLRRQQIDADSALCLAI
jgi:hypothetical protein